MRIKLKKGEQKNLIQGILKERYLTADQLGMEIGVCGRTIRDWRREKFLMSFEAFNRLTTKFKTDKPKVRKILPENWQIANKEIARRGALARYARYGNPGTPGGRQKGGHRSMLKRLGNFKPFCKPLPSDDLAEFVGILLGDGSIWKNQWTITLNSEVDKVYSKFVYYLIKRIFRFTPSVYKRKDSQALVICGSGKKSIDYFLSIGLKIGNKVKQQVGVPKWILKNRKYSLACLRGLMDTDGGIFLHNYRVGGKSYTYKKICFSNRSLPILNFVCDVLRNHNFTPKLVAKVENKKVWLYNKDEVEQYLRVVGTHNSRLLKYQGRVTHEAKRMVC